MCESAVAIRRGFCKIITCKVIKVICKVIAGGGSLLICLCMSALGAESTPMPNPANAENSSYNPTNTQQAQKASSQTVYDLGRIEQVSKGLPTNNASVATVDSKDIANTASKSVDEAIRFMPGVFIQPAAGSRGEPSINIRGYGTTQLGLFIDGIPVYSIYDRQTDFSQFSTYDISEIAISKGYTSPVFGINTMGGAINVITSKPKNKLEVRASYGIVTNGSLLYKMSANEHRVGLSVGGNTGKFYYQASYSFTDRDSLNTSHSFTPTAYYPTKTIPNSYYKNHTVKAKVGFEPNENHEYSINLIYQKGDKGGLISANDDSRGVWNWPNYDKTTVYILGKSRFSEKIGLDSRIYWDNFYNKLIGPSFQSVYNDHSLGIIEALNIAFDSKKELKLGVNLRYNYTYNPNYNIAGLYTYTDSYQDFTSSEFIQYAQSINDTFRFMISGSYDRVDTVKAIKESKKVGYKNDPSGFSLQGIMFADWDSFNTTHINVGQKTNLPTLKDRYGTPWGARIANPNLKSESAINYEIGHSFENESTRVSVAVFFNHLTNMVVTSTGWSGCASPDSRDGCSKLINVNQGYSYGGELSIRQGLFANRLVLGANYTYIQKHTDYQSSATERTTYNRILTYPNHNANAYVSLMPIKAFDVNVYASYQSPQWSYTGGSYAYINDIFLMDIKANYRPTKAIELSLGTYNLLDRNYYYGSYYYQAGRRIYASVAYSF